ncbi:protein FAM110D [Rhinatrema bivittatum]|uniref:protein FAM110D n=1 Tax=Rhinatrema bivittatum TaxID=194408 RepID=UPI00112D9D56|nr:protein FAM110D [Rhinatrema bivittatum]
MKRAPLASSSSPLGLLNRGPGYLRRQIEMSSGSRTPSAVERLEADKSKYVKTQEVMNTRQDPVLTGCATPLLHRTRGLVVAQWCNNPDQDSEQNWCCAQQLTNGRPSQPVPVLRRNSGKRLLRPDSLVMYRQKRDCKVVNKENAKGGSLVRRLFQGSLREKPKSSPSAFTEEPSPTPKDDTQMLWVPVEKEGVRLAQGPISRQLSPIMRRRAQSSHLSPLISRRAWTPEQRRRESTGACLPLNPAKSPFVRAHWLEDSGCKLHLRCSLALSEKERFFDHCGLDRDLVELLGMDTFFSSGWDAVALPYGSADSEEQSEHSQSSYLGAEPAEEESNEKTPSPISVIERNARVIKWLYSCQRAKEKPRESTV